MGPIKTGQLQMGNVEIFETEELHCRDIVDLKKRIEDLEERVDILEQHVRSLVAEKITY